MGEFASKGVAGAGLGLGVAGTALGLMNSGWLGNGNWGNGCGNNGWGRNGGCGYGYGVSDIGISEALANRDMRIAQLEARAYSDESDLAVYKYFDGKFKELSDRLCAQEVFNATASGTMKVLADQIGQLQTLIGSITRTAIPQSAICDFNSGCNCAVSST